MIVNYLLRVFRFLGSLHLGVALLVTFFLLVFWGTLFEARVGLERGVERFFDSWFFWAAGKVPLPALKSLAILFFVNIFFACIFRIPHNKKNFGILLVHIALLVLIVGSFVGNLTREDWNAVAMSPHGTISLDSTAATTFEIVKADSAHVLVLPRASAETLCIAPNEPQKIGGYTAYYNAVHEISPNKTFVLLNVRKDPIDFVPYLFTVLLITGLVWNFVASRCGGKK